MSVGQIFTLKAPIFIVVINVRPRPNWKMITNSLTAVIEFAVLARLTIAGQARLLPSRIRICRKWDQ